MRRLFLILFLTLLAGWVSRAAPGRIDRNTVHSQSGMFVIAGETLPAFGAVVYGVDPNWNTLVPTGRQPGRRPPSEVAQQNPSELPTVDLDPAYLAATAERIKKSIWERLGIGGPHHGKVYVTLLEPTDPPQDILVMHFHNGRVGNWDYKLEVPKQVSADQLLRALTHVILQEAANRHRRGALAEVPYWLTQGLAAHLAATEARAAVFEPGKKVSYTVGLTDELPALRREIGGQSLFTLEQMSWPGTLEPGPETERTYRLTSHGMVLELLRLPGGGAGLGRMLQLLPVYQNWQFAFLQAFSSRFPTLSDFEKWWAVTSLDLSSAGRVVREPPAEESVFRTELDLERWQRVTTRFLGDRSANEEWPASRCYFLLSDLLVVPIEWQTEVDGEVSMEQVPLRDIIHSMEFTLQVPVIEQRVAQLFGLQLHAPDEMVELVRDYRLALEGYLVKREASYQVNTFRNQPETSTALVTRNVLETLDVLEERRAALRESLFSGDPAPEGQVADLAP